MIDRSLLSRLPIPALIKLATLSHDEAVDRLRHAARLCLDGARSLAFEDQQQKDLADKLIEDALTLYDLALQRRHPPPLSDSPAMVHVNASTDSPSVPPTPWDDQFAQEIASGTRCAERWLERQNTQPLWWQLTQARINHPEGDRRNAFEAGFLRRLQHHLIAAQHQHVRRSPG
ncbi:MULTISPECIES: LasR-specific antiactivator QslA [Pseudomonas]|uniref:LasR-specific antiactivator QslA n=1 Tax=Pseudomonas TaxID=286 RepID=UPI000C2FD749|nr:MULTISPECIES: LasR-specific antiactivator QslA [Pseudomonas]MBV6754247.1 hypothetical protein [Pseudomonas chlororaphis]MCU1736999.1 LasR-specific antiactivator QslA [Pseudomonas sp. 20S_6.2_Bac1]RBH52766.1 hypothetical protein C3F00_030105 [Pseudomonas sp. MWU13-2860]